ncbi:MAG: hypothetical protein IK079_01010 [Desulfovibrio sp.]|nr:hypothetical protein [Desulfovibrio sp.]
MLRNILLFFLICVFSGPQLSMAIGLGESMQVSQNSVFLSEGYGGPLPSSLQLVELGTVINHGFNQEATLLGMLLQEVTKKSLDTEALLKGIGNYHEALEILLKDLQINELTQKAAFEQKKDALFGNTPYKCSDALTAQALKEAKKSMRIYANDMKQMRLATGEGTQPTEVKAEAIVAEMLFSIMEKQMPTGHPDALKVPSSASMFPYSGVINKDGGRLYQAIISAVNSEPMPVIRDSQSFNGRRALELQGIKMGRIAGVQEGLQIAFDLQNAVINGQAFSQMQSELQKELNSADPANDEYLEGAQNDNSGAISILQALQHQFERMRIANPDWYTKIDHTGMSMEGLMRELLKIEAWRGFMETQNLRINMINAYNLAQLTGMMMERHDNSRIINYVYPHAADQTEQK